MCWAELYMLAKVPDTAGRLSHIESSIPLLMWT